MCDFLDDFPCVCWMIRNVCWFSIFPESVFLAIDDADEKTSANVSAMRCFVVIGQIPAIDLEVAESHWHGLF